MLPHPALSTPRHVTPRYAAPYTPPATYYRPSPPPVRVYSTSYAYGVPAPPQFIRPLPEQAPSHSSPANPLSSVRPPQYVAAAQECLQAARSERVKLYAFLAVFLIWVTAWGALAYVYVQGGL